MKFKILAAALLAVSASLAQASVIDYNLNIQDTNGDSFVGQAVYDTSLDVFTAATGTITYADGASGSDVLAMDFNYTGNTGTQQAASVSDFGPPVIWEDGIIDSVRGTGLYIGLDNSPSSRNPELDAQTYFIDDGGNQFVISNGSMTATAATNVPEPASLALLAAGLIGAGVSRRKSAR